MIGFCLVTLLVKIHTQLEGGLCQRNVLGRRRQPLRYIFRRKQVLTVCAVSYPIHHHRRVVGATEFEGAHLVDRRVGAFVDTPDLTVFIDPNRRRHVNKIVQRADGVVLVNQSYKRRFRLVVPGARDGFATSILGSSDDNEVLVLQLFVNGLPT